MRVRVEIPSDEWLCHNHKVMKYSTQSDTQTGFFVLYKFIEILGNVVTKSL
jgi:hypothetical protein